MYQHIYVPVDNSDYSNRAIDLAVELGRGFGAKLTGCHVYAARLHDYRFKQMEYTLPEEYKDENELERQRKIHDSLIAMGLQLISDSYLDVMARKADEAGLAFDRKMVDGKHYKALIEDAQASGYDLVVMGALGMGAVKDSQLGSVTERFVRRVTADTLVVRNHDPLKDQQGGIVVGLDGSPQSFHGLKIGIALARALGRPLHAVAVYDPYLHYAMFNGIVGVLNEKASKIFRFKEQEQLHEEIIDTGLAKIYQSHLEIGRKLDAIFGGELPANLQMRLIDLGQPGIDDLLVQLLLLFEAKDFRGFFIQHADDPVEHGVVEVRVVDRDRPERAAERLGEEDAQLQSVEGLGRAIEAHDDRALRTRESVGVADDQRVLRNPADEALGDGAELAVLHGAHAEGAHDDQVIVGGEAVLDEHLVVLAVDHLALEGEPRGLGAPGHDVEVGIGDELQAHGDQRVVDLPLALELVLVLVLIRQRVLHLLEPVVMEPRRVHVDAGQPGAARPAQLDGQVDRPVRIVRVVHRNADVLEHGPSLSQLELDRRHRPGRDRHLFRDRPRLVVHRPAILVGALGPEARVPYRDLVGPRWDVRDPKGPALVRDRDVGAVVDQDPGGHVRVGVAQDVHDPGLREPPSDVDHLALVGQGQVEDRRAAEESVSVVEDRVGVLHVGTVASAQRGDVGDEEALAVVEDHVAAARFAPRDALDQHDATLHAVVGAEHERLGRVRLAADVPVLVDRDRVELRRRADELQGPGHGAAVRHSHDLVRRAAARRGEREHREEDER